MSFLNVLPSGVILPYGGPTAPEGWVICAGQSVSVTAYPALFAAIGYTWGNPGGGSFSLPHLVGAFMRGSGTNGNNVGPVAVGVGQSQSDRDHNHVSADLYATLVLYGGVVRYARRDVAPFATFYQSSLASGESYSPQVPDPPVGVNVMGSVSSMNNPTGYIQPYSFGVHYIIKT